MMSVNSSSEVSIHAPARGATHGSLPTAVGDVSFNPRPRAGGDHEGNGQHPRVEMFQSTPPRGGRLDKRPGVSKLQRFQSTPPRGGRLTISAWFLLMVVVSIHAPARGATPHASALVSRRTSFNPRPRAGGDRLLVPITDPDWLFQSTPPRGGRRRSRAGTVCKEMGFNPRPRAGGDANAYKEVAAVSGFQSTPPRGGRPVGFVGRAGRQRRFNPRPRAGGDQPMSLCSVRSLWFQSTPPRGGRPAPWPGFPGGDHVSIHAPARGATSASRSISRVASGFNPRPRAGGDAGHPNGPCRALCFNPRPRAGGDPPPGPKVPHDGRVSIHAPARGATRRWAACRAGR